MQLSVENSRRVANISFLCACAVVLVHVRWPQDGEVGRVLVWTLRNTLASLVVPLFSTIAGFMLAGHFDEPGWWRKAVVKRVRTLLVPFVAWMAVATVLLWLCTGRRPIGFANSGLDPCRYPLVVPLWYLRALFLVVAASPLIRAANERWGWRALALEGLANVAVMTLIGLGILSTDEGLGGLLIKGIPVETLFYFSLGAWIRRHPVPPFGRKAALTSALVAGTLLAASLFALQRHVFLPVNLYALAVPFWLIALWHVAPASPWPRYLVASSFAVYVMHAVVLSVIFALDPAFPFWLATLLGIAIPIFVFNVLTRFAPGVAGFLFGGRVK